MAWTTSYLPQSTYSGPFKKSNPTFSQGRFAHHPLTTASSQWFYPVTWSIPIGGRTPRRLRILLPNLIQPYRVSVRRLGRRTSSFLWLLVLLVLSFTFIRPLRVFVFGKPSTLIYPLKDLQVVWNWEVENGHYPSHQPIPRQLGFLKRPHNPGIPSTGNDHASVSHVDRTLGTGPQRTYLDIKVPTPGAAYPGRPVAGSVADLDLVMEQCDPWEDKKYVRDCLEFLRVGGGLDNGNRLRRGKLDQFKYIFTEDVDDGAIHNIDPRPDAFELHDAPLPPPKQHRHRPSTRSAPCDPNNPRIFHMFWAGPFTDKPYMALLSFLFTQNTGLHLDVAPSTVCRPQIWVWINPGPAASVPNPSAYLDMQAALEENPWASPFLHHRFQDVIHFKLWNTTEQLNAIPELRNEKLTKNLFKSEGKVVAAIPVDDKGGAGTTKKNEANDMLNRVGSSSSKTYDRLSVILSDMARFILCHRYGGTYIDADTIFLRDWEELWGWKGAFAYRWSWKKEYNTAVLHMNRGSALGTFLFKTAVANGLDFHPEMISRYTKEAYLEGLLLRLPDALFDSPWLNTDKFQRERPPQPYFKAFSEFFDPPLDESAAPQALGFDGFFKGAYSYHYHNFWWEPFDSARNWPDLGPRFVQEEDVARNTAHGSDHDGDDNNVNEAIDTRDLSWANVMKRTFEAYVRGERPNMYGEWLHW